MTTRRDLIAGAAAAMAAPLLATDATAAGPSAGVPCSSLLAALIERQGQLERASSRLCAEADDLEYAIDDGDPAALARQAELPVMRARSDELWEASLRNADAIDGFEAQSPADVLAKLKRLAQELGHLPGAACLDPDACDTDSEQGRMILSMYRDLQRLAGVA